MTKKLTFKVDYFEEYELLSVASHLKDYRLAYFINEHLGLELQKFDDFKLKDEKRYSWFCYSEGENGSTFYLIGNTHPDGLLIPSQKGIDYFLLIKDLFDDNRLKGLTTKLRGIKGVMGVFRVEMDSVKNLDLMIENLELHELEKVIKPSREETGIRAR